MVAAALCSGARTLGADLEMGLSLRQGLSVWAPTTTKPAPGAASAPTAKATSVEPPRTKNRRSPGARCQASRSESSVKPAARSTRTDVATLWNAVGLAFR